MSDYARVHDFSVKDALSSGDPNKLIKGSEVDAELDAIVTMSATKIDEPSSPNAGDALVFSSGAWGASPLVPIATVLPYAGSSLPTGWLWCDGSSISTTTYSDLFDVIGYDFGGSGANFNLPDLRGRAVFGMDNMDNSVGTGGGDAGRLTSGGKAAIDGDTIGSAGGDEDHTLLTAEMPAHTHPNSHPSTNTFGGTDAFGSGANPGTTTGSTGGGGAHNNMPPALVLNYIIKT